MVLQRLEIRRFRSLYSVEIELKPITIVIGPNSSGKSNLFKALRFLHDATAGDIQDWHAYSSEQDDLLWYGVDAGTARRPTEFGLTTLFHEPREQRALQYLASFEVGTYLEVLHERLETLRSAEASEPLFERQHRNVKYWAGWSTKSRKSPRRETVRSARNLTLRDEGPNPSFRGEKIYQQIRGWRFFEVDPKTARKSHPIPLDPEEVPPLMADAANLSAFLYALHRLRSTDLEAIIDAISRSIELPRAILVEHEAERTDSDVPSLIRGTQARYALVEAPFGEGRPIPPASISDGTIRLLAHVALLLADRSVSLACLEEPDSGLHPRLMIHLADALRQAVQTGSEGQSLQVLLTTHSPELMDCFDLAEEAELVQVYVAERGESGETLLVPVTSEEFAPWLERYRLGEAVRRNFV